jgi:hypothetical protein
MQDVLNPGTPSVRSSVPLLLAAADDVDRAAIGSLQQCKQRLACIQDGRVRVEVEHAAVNFTRVLRRGFLAHQPVIHATQIVRLLKHVLGNHDVRGRKLLRANVLGSAFVIGVDGVAGIDYSRHRRRVDDRNGGHEGNCHLR